MTTPFRRGWRGSVLFISAIFLLASQALAQEEAPLSTALNYKSLQPGQQAVLAVVLDIPPGLHSQSHKPLDEFLIPFEIKVDDNPAVEAFAPVYPEGHIETYPALGKVSVYTGRLVVYVPLQVKPGAATGPVKLTGTVQYQLCNDTMCFNPQQPAFEVQTELVAPGQPVEPNQPELFANFDPRIFSNLVKPAAPVQRVSIFGRDLDEAPVVFAFFAAFVIGMIFNVVPCVLPVVPIKAMGFYEVSQHNRAKCLALGTVFSAGLIASFAVLGLLVVVLRKFEWGEQFSNPWFLAAIILILLVMAANMFGAFEVGLPDFVLSATPRHDTYTGNFLFGILTAVLSTPCTFGMFLGLLIWASRQPAALGMSLMITVGAGMAFPYLVLSAFPSLVRNLPRSGPWAQLVKQMMGFLLLASAVYFARVFLEQWVGHDAFWWALFAVVAAAGAFLILRTVQFARTYVGPVVAACVALLFVAPTFAMTWRLTNPPIDWQPYSEASLAQARQSGKPVMVEFTAAWCGNCLALEATVFHDERTVKTIKQHDVVTLRADLSKSDAPGWKLLRQISAVGAIPLTAVYAPGRDEPLQLSGIYTTDQLVTTLTEAAAKPKLARR
jgi:thiol:disulfide interchange protein DsbD